VGWMRGLN